MGRIASETNLECIFSMFRLGRNHLSFTSTKNTWKSGQNRLLGAFLAHISKNGHISAQILTPKYAPWYSRLRLMCKEHSQNTETPWNIIFGRAEVTCNLAKSLKNHIFHKLTFWISAQFGPPSNLFGPYVSDSKKALKMLHDDILQYIDISNSLGSIQSWKVWGKQDVYLKIGEIRASLL